MRKSSVRAFPLFCSALIAVLCVSHVFSAVPQSRADLDAMITSGQLLYRLTEPPEVTALFGEPTDTNQLREGEMLIQLFRYPGMTVAFGRRPGSQSPFVLIGIEFQGQRLNLRDMKVTLRTEKDLAKFDDFSGFQNVSLANLDLRQQADLLERMPFDTSTEWPPAEKLPPNFNPAERLRAGLYPGLGMRRLHEEGIDGKGVGIAIIDQPFLRDHVEYRDAIASYELIGVEGAPPQMHGPAVACIAVGKNRGVAPGARLTFFATPTWKRDNQPYIDGMKKILELNRTKPDNEKIRVVSISTGMFSQQPHYEEWLAVRKEADASGVFVITCDHSALAYGTLVRVPGRDPDDPESYRPGRYQAPNRALLVPAGNMTRATHTGPEAYALDPEGGMSWAAPYIAGLAALAYQVDPGVSPARIRAALSDTVTRTSAGPVVNPRRFIEVFKKQLGK